MTQDCKNTILKYLTGKINQETENNKPLLNQISPVDNNLTDFIKQYYPAVGDRWVIQTLVTRGDYILLWCSDYVRDPVSRWAKSWIIVCDKDYNPIRFIDSYKSGTPLQSLALINTDDDGSGNIIGVEYVYVDGQVSYRRIAIINDFTIDNFDVKLLSSWNIPQHNNADVIPVKITKNPNAGKYFIMYYTDYENSTIGGAIEFVNNVGSENEWNFYQYSGTKNISFSGSGTGIPSWENDVFSFKLFYNYEISKDSRNNNVQIVILKQNDDEENKSAVEDKTISLPNECKNVSSIGSFTVITNQLLVCAGGGEDENKTTYVIKFNTDDSSYKILYSKEDYPYEKISSNEYKTAEDAISIFQINGQFYFTRRYSYYDLIITPYTIIYYENVQYLAQIFNDNVYEFQIRDLGQSTNTTYELYKNNTYNLIEIGFIYRDIIYKIKEIFNILNYNGEPYENINSLVPKYVNLYANKGGEASEIVFSRNLYNKVINGNVTQSTIEIPNTQLNDVVLNSEYLIGDTNKTLITKNYTIEKNIYETLLLNFYTTINIKNSNDPQNEILNPTGASKLNKSMSNDTDYDNSKATKIKVYYDNNTSFIRELNQLEILNQDNLTTYIFNIFVPTDKNVEKIEIISNDENTVYQTISNMNLEKGNLYQIKQECEII